MSRNMVKTLYSEFMVSSPQAVFDSIEAASLSPGFREAWFEARGLMRNQLKVLERLGLAVRGYTKNYWESGDPHPETGETIPMGKSKFGGQEFEFKKQFRGKGSKVVWVLLANPMEPSAEVKDEGGNTSLETISDSVGGLQTEFPVAGQPKASPQT